MRVGVSIMTGDKQHVWNNGLTQNIYHFVTLLSQIPFVEAVYLINCGDRPTHPQGSDDEALRFPIITQAEASDVVDVAIEMGGAIDVEWIRRFRFQGGKFVIHQCGQPYVALIEPTVFNREGFFIEAARCEEIWLLAKDMIFAPMLRTIHRCPVNEVPYLWSPRFLEQTVQRGPNDEPLYGYRRGGLKTGTARPAIFEPNISPIKMGLIPQMICDVAARQAPGVIDYVTYLNGDGKIEHPTYVCFMQSMRTYQDGKVQIIGRDYFSHVMGRGCNMVVSHQLHCPQNYVYLDALYGLYPLIHNSVMFKDVGYYYEDSDIVGGAKLFLDAVEGHDENLEDYAKRAGAMIASLSPTSPVNINHYARRLLSLVSAGRKRRSA